MATLRFYLVACCLGEGVLLQQFFQWLGWGGTILISSSLFLWPIAQLLQSFSKSLSNFFALCQVWGNIDLNQWQTLSAMMCFMFIGSLVTGADGFPFRVYFKHSHFGSRVSEDKLGANQLSLMERTSCFLSLDRFKSYSECYKMLLCVICAVLCSVI